MDPGTFSFNFDDLLVSCSKEILEKGLDSEAIPQTIRDWLCGRIVKSLPKKLLDRLLRILLQNREASDFLCLKEYKNFNPNNQNLPDQLVIFVYKNENRKRKHEEDVRLSKIKKSKNFISDTSVEKTVADGDAGISLTVDDSLTARDLPTLLEQDKSKKDHTEMSEEMFAKDASISKQTFSFYADEFLVEKFPPFKDPDDDLAKLRLIEEIKLRTPKISSGQVIVNGYRHRANKRYTEPSLGGTSDFADTFEESGSDFLPYLETDDEIEHASQGGKFPVTLTAKGKRDKRTRLPPDPDDTSDAREKKYAHVQDREELHRLLSIKEDEYMPGNLLNCFLCPLDERNRRTKALGPKKRPPSKYFEKFDQFATHAKRNHSEFYEKNNTLFAQRNEDGEATEKYDDSVKEALQNKELAQLPGDSRFHCSVCSAAFPAAKPAIWHLRSEHGLADPAKKMKFCSPCNRSFTHRNWSQHIKRHHKNEDEKFECELCQAKYARSDKIIEHKRSKHPNAYTSQNEQYQFLKEDRKLFPEKYYKSVTINPLTRKPMPTVSQVKAKTFRHACTVMKQHGLMVPDSSVKRLNEMSKFEVHDEVDRALQRCLAFG